MAAWTVILRGPRCGSPAKATLTALVTGSRDGVVPVPLLPVAVAAVLAVAAVGLACGMASRRG